MSDVFPTLKSPMMITFRSLMKKHTHCIVHVKTLLNHGIIFINDNVIATWMTWKLPIFENAVFTSQGDSISKHVNQEDNIPARIQGAKYKEMENKWKLNKHLFCHFLALQRKTICASAQPHSNNKKTFLKSWVNDMNQLS